MRVYSVRESAAAGSDLAPPGRADALVDVVVNKYAPLPGPSLSYRVSRLRYAVPQWRGELKAALARAKNRLAQARHDGVEWTCRPVSVCPKMPLMTQSGCSRHLTRWCGIGGGSSCSGDGPIASKPTPGFKTEAWLLRTATAVGRSDHRVEQPVVQCRRAAGGVRPRINLTTVVLNTALPSRRTWSPDTSACDWPRGTAHAFWNCSSIRRNPRQRCARLRKGCAGIASE